MVARADEAHAGLARQVHGGFGDLARDVGGGAGVHRVGQHALRAAGAPGHAAQRLGGIAHHQRLAAQAFAHARGQVAQRGQAGGVAQPDEIVLPTGARRAVVAQRRRQAQHACQLGVVAQLRMGVQRQVVGVQVQVVVQRQRHAGAASADDAAVLVAPHPAVMDQHRVRAALDSHAQERLAGGDSGDNVSDLGTAFHLQPVGAVVLESGGLQGVVQPVGQDAGIHFLHC